MKLTHKITTALGIAYALGSAVTFGLPAQAQVTQPLLAQVGIQLQFGGGRHYRDNYYRNRFPSQRRIYRGNPYNQPYFNNRGSFYPRSRAYGGNVYYPGDYYRGNSSFDPRYYQVQPRFNSQDFYYRGW